MVQAHANMHVVANTYGYDYQHPGKDGMQEPKDHREGNGDMSDKWIPISINDS